MTDQATKPIDASGSPLDRGVRAPHPERAAFEAWCCRRWAGDRGALTIGADDEYINGHVQFAWCAWQAARPNRDAVRALYEVASDLAQRKSLRALEPLTEVSHIGHRQMHRAYSKADEDTRLLAVKLADAVQAL